MLLSVVLAVLGVASIPCTAAGMTKPAGNHLPIVVDSKNLEHFVMYRKCRAGVQACTCVNEVCLPYDPCMVNEDDQDAIYRIREKMIRHKYCPDWANRTEFLAGVQTVHPCGVWQDGEEMRPTEVVYKWWE